MSISNFTYCKFCQQGTLRSNGCLITSIEIDGESVPRMPYTQPYSGEEFEHCHDCNAKNGRYHHPTCDMEICPRCEDQLICCKCDITGALKGIHLK